MHFEKGFQGGKDDAVDKTGTAPSRGQYSRAATFLIAAGSFVEDVLVHVSASELSLGR